MSIISYLLQFYRQFAPMKGAVQPLNPGGKAAMMQMQMQRRTERQLTATDSDNSWLLIAVFILIYTCACVDRQILALLVEPIKADLAITNFPISLLLALAILFALHRSHGRY